MCLIPGFKSYAFETYMNVQPKSPCILSSWVLSEFYTRFSVLTRLIVFQISKNQEISTVFIRNIFELIKKCFPSHVSEYNEYQNACFFRVFI
jgi:hypothetical protein